MTTTLFAPQTSAAPFRKRLGTACTAVFKLDDFLPLLVRFRNEVPVIGAGVWRRSNVFTLDVHEFAPSVITEA